MIIHKSLSDVRFWEIKKKEKLPILKISNMPVMAGRGGRF